MLNLGSETHKSRESIPTDCVAAFFPFQKRGVCLCEANAPPELLSQVWREGRGWVGDLGGWVFPPKKYGKVDLVVTETFQLLLIDMLQCFKCVFVLVVFRGRSQKKQGKILKAKF